MLTVAHALGAVTDDQLESVRLSLVTLLLGSLGASGAAEAPDQRGSTNNVADLYEVLNQAEVPFVRMG